MVLNGVWYGEQVTVQIARWCPDGYFRVGLRTENEDGSTKEFLSWTGRIIPALCTANYIGLLPSFTYTAAVDEAMANMGLTAWVLDDLGLEEYVAM